MKKNKVKPTSVLDIRQLEPGAEFASIADFLNECSQQEPKCKTKMLSVREFQEVVETRWKGKEICAILEIELPQDPHKYLFWFEKFQNRVKLTAREQLTF